MDFDIKKNKPKLIDDTVLNLVIQNKKNKIEIKDEPNMINKITTKIQKSICIMIEENIFYIIFIIIIILLLIYRYFQYKSIKDNQNNNIIIKNNNIPNRKPKEIKYTSSEYEEETGDEDNYNIEESKAVKIIPNTNMYTSHNSNNLDHFEQW
jgi:hypothetical protein